MNSDIKAHLDTYIETLDDQIESFDAEGKAQEAADLRFVRGSIETAIDISTSKCGKVPHKDRVRFCLKTLEFWLDGMWKQFRRWTRAQVLDDDGETVMLMRAISEAIIVLRRHA